MLGHTLFKYFDLYSNHQTFGILRNKAKIKKDRFLFEHKHIRDLNFKQLKYLEEIIFSWDIEIIINCAGVVKQNPELKRMISTIEINSLFPHKLNFICEKLNIRLIHISTDCVFSGKNGFYNEEDKSDADDIYGRTKYLGEVNFNKAVTLRTSFIGKELTTRYGLLNWFLSQKEVINGYEKAIYSGLPTNELARIIEKHVIPNKKLKGLYHISSEPIDKFSLLILLKEVYKKNITILKNQTIEIDRSLDSNKFRNATGYKPIEWYKVIKDMKNFDKLIK